MGLQIAQREKEAIVILDLKGELVLDDDYLSLLQRLLFLLDSRRHKVVLNLKGVSGMDATGPATLAFCAKLFQDIDGRLVVLNPGQPHAQVADILELNTVLETYQEETEAVNSFFPERVVPRYGILEFVKEQEQLRDRNCEAQKLGGGGEGQGEVCGPANAWSLRRPAFLLKDHRRLLLTRWLACFLDR
jgi:anti-sigma B factor antagonist